MEEQKINDGSIDEETVFLEMLDAPDEELDEEQRAWKMRMKPLTDNGMSREEAMQAWFSLKGTYDTAMQDVRRYMEKRGRI